MKLRTKVFILFTSIAIIPLVILTLFAYSRYVQTIEQRMDDISSTLFDNAVENANQTLSSIKQTAGLFTFYSDSDFSIVENLKKFSNPNQGYDSYDLFETNRNMRFIFQNVLYSYDYIYGLYVFTPSGAVLGHSSGLNGDLNVNYDCADQDWYQDTLDLNGKLYISPIGVHDLFSGKKNSMFFSQAIHDVYTHDFLGVLVINCDPALFDLSLLNTMPDITMLTLDNPTTSDVLYTNAFDFDYTFASQNKVVKQQNLNISPLRLVAVFDYSTLFQEYNITGILMIAVAFACATGAILLSYITSVNLTSPIEHLSRKMSSQKGHTLDLTSRYLDRTDEIGTLYNEYNSMVEELNTSVKRDYQDKLILMDAQMKSLEARINSHFLFNTLETINSMAEIDENDHIATMSLALGNMFRYTIKTQSELVTLEEELHHVMDYVSIQTIRFDERFKLELQLDDTLRDLYLLKLILQPLVENSLYHGLNYCTSGDTIAISGHISNGCIYIDVSDNGVGMELPQLETLRSRLREEPSFTELGHRNRQSIGLKNIHSRIELYYGKGYGLSIDSHAGKGTTIHIKVPILNRKEKSNV